MSIISKRFQISTTQNKEQIFAYLKSLSGMQQNQGRWQQGRYRTLSSSDSNGVISMSTKIFRIIPIVKASIRISKDQLQHKYDVRGDVNFAIGVLLILAFFLIPSIVIAYSDFNIIIKLVSYIVILVNFYGVLSGIYCDRELLTDELKKLAKI